MFQAVSKIVTLSFDVTKIIAFELQEGKSYVVQLRSLKFPAGRGICPGPTYNILTTSNKLSLSPYWSANLVTQCFKGRGKRRKLRGNF